MQFFALNWSTGHGAPLPDMEFDPDFEGQLGPAPRCEVCGLYVGSRVWLPPYRAELELWRGTEFADLANFGEKLIVSARFKEVWEQSGLKGLDQFDPVEVTKVVSRSRKKKIGPPPLYFHAAVPLTPTRIDLAASEVEWLGPPPSCQACLLTRSVVKRFKRVVLDENSWTGEDIFCARGLAVPVIASHRFRDACERNRLKGVLLAPAELACKDFYPGMP